MKGKPEIQTPTTVKIAVQQQCRLDRLLALYLNQEGIYVLNGSKKIWHVLGKSKQRSPCCTETRVANLRVAITKKKFFFIIIVTCFK